MRVCDMADLYLHGRKLASIFELLGTKENDITYSIGWALARSPAFLSRLVHHVLPEAPVTDASVYLQQYGADHGGYTDIEIQGATVHIIVEAKRGWWVPGVDQLKKYAARLSASKRPHAAIVAMSECSPEYARLYLPAEVCGFPIHHIGWKEVARLTAVSKVSHAEKRLLAELRAYFTRIVRMQNQTLNMVYVVALGAGTPPWATISMIDLLVTKRRYFHPVGNGWPKEPPNYMGFRYGGRLQSVHHVESWQIVHDMRTALPEIAPEGWPPHFLYRLGPPIVPSKPVRSGKIVRNTRIWAMLDLLLISETVSDARDRTRERLSDIADCEPHSLSS